MCVPDAAIEALLTTCYVAPGYTDSDVAESLFVAESVRRRGELLVVVEPPTSELLGMAIVVEASSPARQLVLAGTAELQMLAVSPRARCRGIGRALIEAAMKAARDEGYARMVLSTQPPMHAAQRLYEALGFVRTPARDWQRGGKRFLTYEIVL